MERSIFWTATEFPFAPQRTGLQLVGGSNQQHLVVYYTELDFTIAVGLLHLEDGQLLQLSIG